jgi:capsular exopolysaccharide synthesis family protein
MSVIFDALQRSEKERTGAEESVLSTATQLLQLVERQTVSERKTEVLSELPKTITNAEHATLSAPPAMESISTAAGSLPGDELSSNDKQPGLFAQFQSIRVLVPPERQLPCSTDSEGLAAEKFRFLGVRLRHLRRERSLKKVLITSTIPHEGKSMVAANLACTLARRGQQRTLLLEGDVRRPSLSHLFGLNKLPGICEWLQSEQSQITNIYHLDGLGLWILPAGNASGNPLELLQSRRLSTLMDQLSTMFDWIVIDCPPVLPLADTSVWSRIADGILLVTRQGTTDKRQLQRGLEAIDREKLIGAVLNCSQSSATSDHYYYYRPSTTSQQDDIPKK